MKNFTLYFISFNGRGREVTFTLTLGAANESDARTVGNRMVDVMGWQLVGLDEAA
jgi:hypothetical protein